jgi:excisionase family DNA binding protein
LELLGKRNEKMTKEPERYMTIKEASTILRVDQSTFRRYIKAGIFPAIALPHLGKRKCHLIRRSDIMRLLGEKE